MKPLEVRTISLPCFANQCFILSADEVLISGEEVWSFKLASGKACQIPGVEKKKGSPAAILPGRLFAAIRPNGKQLDIYTLDSGAILETYELVGPQGYRDLSGLRRCTLDVDAMSCSSDGSLLLLSGSNGRNYVVDRKKGTLASVSRHHIENHWFAWWIDSSSEFVTAGPRSISIIGNLEGALTEESFLLPSQEYWHLTSNRSDGLLGLSDSSSVIVMNRSTMETVPTSITTPQIGTVERITAAERSPQLFVGLRSGHVGRLDLGMKTWTPLLKARKDSILSLEYSQLSDTLFILDIATLAIKRFQLKFIREVSHFQGE